MRILITGVNGQLGYDAMVVTVKREYECFASDTSLTHIGPIDFETTLEYVPMEYRNRDAVKNALRDIKPVCSYRLRGKLGCYECL